MKRLLQCEEWSRLRVGRGLELETFDDLTTILSAWKRNTGVDPSGYFDIRSDALMPKFWSGTLDTPKFTLEVSIGSTALGDTMRARLDSSISAMLATATSSQSMSAGIASLSGDGGRYDALLGVFCDELRLARRRQVLRRYVSVRESVPSPKGRIAFPSQCYESIRRPGRFSSEWVALTEDIPENKIFKEVLVRYRPRCSANIRGKIDFSWLSWIPLFPLLITGWSGPEFVQIDYQTSTFHCSSKADHYLMAKGLVFFPGKRLQQQRLFLHHACSSNLLQRNWLGYLHRWD